MKKIFIFAISAALFSGCAGTVIRNEGTKIDRAKVLDLKPGATARQTVLDTFGNPDNINFQNNEEKMTYIFKEKKTPSYLGGLIENEVRSTESANTLEIVLRNGVVYSYRFRSLED